MLAQIGAIAAIEDTDYWNETRRRIIATRDKTIARLRELGYNVPNSQANFLFLGVNGYGAGVNGTGTASNAAALYEYLYDNKILVRYWNKPGIDGYLRVSIGTDKEMEAFIECVKQYSKG
jgi:histidinol-phosphate aminotransferase